jgi:very-short-patch-repair endonuclease
LAKDDQRDKNPGFVLDFAFPDSLVAFEIDGYYHQFSKAKDAFRDYILRRSGWTIVHIPAEDLGDEPSIIASVFASLEYPVRSCLSEAAGGETERPARC